MKRDRTHEDWLQSDWGETRVKQEGLRGLVMMMMVKTFSAPSHTHLPCLVIVFDLAQIPAAGLSDPLPGHQVPNHHRGGADL